PENSSPGRLTKRVRMELEGRRRGVRSSASGLMSSLLLCAVAPRPPPLGACSAPAPVTWLLPPQRSMELASFSPGEALPAEARRLVGGEGAVDRLRLLGEGRRTSLRPVGAAGAWGEADPRVGELLLHGAQEAQRLPL